MRTKAKQRAIEYLKNFTDDISCCKNIDEYYELIISVFVFSELVHNHFKELYDKSDEADILLTELHHVAKNISTEACEVAVIDATKKSDLN